MPADFDLELFQYRYRMIWERLHTTKGPNERLNLEAVLAQMRKQWQENTGADDLHERATGESA